jgi:predicted nucleic acid-binding protein
MKNYIIDANIIFSALISGKEAYFKLFSLHQFYLPDYALQELEKYRQVILKKRKTDNETFKSKLLGLFSLITIVPDLVISTENFEQALALCSEIDEKDTPYVALSIELDMTLVTRDVKLHDGLLAKGFENVILFDRLFADL